MDKINRESILSALQEIDAKPELRKGRASSTYDLIFEGKEYPPKLVISIANRYATGEELPANDFDGGDNTKAFEVLRKYGFVINKKVDNVEKYLNEFKAECDAWFEKQTWLIPRYKFFDNFFKSQNLAKATWEDFQEMGNNLHCFTTNALAKANAFGRPNDTIENYRKNFEYLVRGEASLNVRLNKLNDKKSEFKIKYLSDSALSELIGYAYPNEYVFYNSRSKKALKFLGVALNEIKGSEFGDQFDSYNKTIKPVIESYQRIIGKRTQTTIQLEVDQFFSWLCDVKIKPFESKYDFFPILKKFIDQAQTTDQSYTHYPKTYSSLDINVRFGMGPLFPVPYLALLKRPNKVPDGIYPVYLYYKKHNVLILSYGLSETNSTKNLWPEELTKQTIESYYQNKFDERPYKYGDSFVKSVYDLTDDLDPELIQNDLNEILKVYDKINFTLVDVSNENINLPAITTMDFNNKYRKEICAIKTKPFLLMAGISGTGKSRMVRTLAYKTCPEKLRNGNNPGNFINISVKPNWHDSIELVGYISRIDGTRYIITDFIKFIIQAWSNLDTPFFVCLDEMNLAPVEQYFAEYLSKIESRKKEDTGIISTDSIITSDIYNSYKENFEEKNTPDHIKSIFEKNGIGLPPNLVIIGTVNMDETTHSFSRKVLDRAMTFEKNLDNDEGILKLNLGEEDWNYNNPIDQGLLLVNEIKPNQSIVDNFAEHKTIIDRLNAINKILNNTSFMIAYRTLDEAIMYAFHNSQCTNKPKDWTDHIMDDIIVMKILPRIEGDESKTMDVLVKLEELFKSMSAIISIKKCQIMLSRLKTSGYTSFWN